MPVACEAEIETPPVEELTKRVAEIKVLVVDDSPVDRGMAVKILERRPGLRAIHAPNGREALAVIEREAPVLVLTDMLMPEMDGLELVGEVRRLHPRIPVIVMTAHGSEDVAIQALRAGAASYVPKKTLAADLLTILDQVLKVATQDRRRQQVLTCLNRRESWFEMENDSALIAPLIALLQGDLGGMGLWDETARMRVGIALEEALTNALFHGNLEVSSSLRQDDERAYFRQAEERRAAAPFRDRRVLVHADLSRESVRIVIRDEGPGFDTTSLKREIDPESLMMASGRGLLLIRTFMDEIRFNPSGNEITMIKNQ